MSHLIEMSALPAGWNATTDKEGKVYYYSSTGEVAWEKPTASAAAATRTITKSKHVEEQTGAWEAEQRGKVQHQQRLQKQQEITSASVRFDSGVLPWPASSSSSASSSGEPRPQSKSPPRTNKILASLGRGGGGGDHGGASPWTQRGFPSGCYSTPGDDRVRIHSLALLCNPNGTPTTTTTVMSSNAPYKQGDGAYLFGPSKTVLLEGPLKKRSRSGNATQYHFVLTADALMYLEPVVRGLVVVGPLTDKQPTKQ